MKRIFITSTMSLFIFCATTNVEMLGKALPPISKSYVKEFDETPNGAKEIAIIEVKLFSNYNGVETNWEIVDKAAALGANGYVILNKNEIKEQRNINPLDNTNPVAYMSPVNNTPVYKSSTPKRYRVVAKVFYIAGPEIINTH